MESSDAPILSRHVQDLADSWQARVLRETCHMAGLGILKPKGKIGMAVLSVFAHGLDAHGLVIMLRPIWPEFYSIGEPFLSTAAKIDKRGCIVADMVMRDNEPPWKNHVLFHCTRDMEAAFRRLADRCRLNDTDRLKLFAAVKQWVVADRRLDPTMNPADPDARRLVLH